MIKHLTASAILTVVVAIPAAAQDKFTLPSLDEKPENHLCPDAPAMPDWIGTGEAGPQASKSLLAQRLYSLQGLQNVVDAGECTCDLRFPSWDAVLETMDSEYADLTRHEHLSVMRDIRHATGSYRQEAKAICEQVGLW